MEYRLKVPLGQFRPPHKLKVSLFSEYYLCLYANEIENGQVCFEFHINNIPDLLQQGIIEEISEPKWTDEDLIEFAKIPFANSIVGRDVDFEVLLKLWKESKEPSK